MKKILIYMDINDNEYGIFQHTDYSILDSVIQSERRGNCPNYGNKVWLQGLVSELTTKNVEIKFYNNDMDFEEINSYFDCVIKPSANIFSPEYINSLNALSEKFSHIKIPIYIIACGIQLNRYKEMDSLVEIMRESATRFIRTIYATGGEFALRGYITKEFFTKLGFDSAVVTGCPSLFQNGRGLHIEKKKTEKETFKAVVNGQNYLMSTSFYMRIFKDYPNSIFVDQDHYYNYLYNPNYFKEDSFSVKDMIKRVKDKGYLGLKLVSSNRLVLFADVPNWSAFIHDNGFDVSFGARIHGNIVSLLSGVPAILNPCDIRTEEMGDFFDIPMVHDNELKNHKDIFDLYEKLDYSKFNKAFKDKYDFYQKFFTDRDIIDEKLNQENIFWSNTSSNDGKAPISVNIEQLEKMNRALNKHKVLYEIENKAFYLYRK